MREGRVERKTGETTVTVRLGLDGEGRCTAETGLGFLDHMLAQLARHALLDLEIRAEGDLEVDGHHTTEDTGIALGQALAQALGERTGVQRYGHAYVPMDEALTRVALDLSNRPLLVWKVAFQGERIGSFDTQLVREFFQALSQNGGITLHVETLYGANDHHVAESCFKALARALRTAVEPDPRASGQVPSTKGAL